MNVIILILSNKNAYIVFEFDSWFRDIRAMNFLKNISRIVIWNKHKAKFKKLIIIFDIELCKDILCLNLKIFLVPEMSRMYGCGYNPT